MDFPLSTLGSSPEPMTATSEPTATAPKPSAATPKPSAATAEPSAATAEPTVTTPEPAAAPPEPTTVQTECDIYGGNGLCDDMLNHFDCEYDKGDCCPCEHRAKVDTLMLTNDVCHHSGTITTRASEGLFFNVRGYFCLRIPVLFMQAF